jgi:hypothetical protein
MPLRRRSDTLPKRDPIRDAIETRAFELFLARGGTHGHDVEDWLKAEHELTDRRRTGGTRRRVPDTELTSSPEASGQVLHATDFEKPLTSTAG